MTGYDGNGIAGRFHNPPITGRLETNWADITAQQRRHAIRTCAAHAHTADQLADYCAALGLNPKEGRP